MFYGHAMCWVLGETPRRRGIGAKAVEVEYEPLPSLITITEAIAAESFQGAQRTVARGDADAAFGGCRARVHRRVRIRRPGALLPGDQRRAGLVDENGQIFIQSSTQHPTETQEIVAHVLGLSSHRSPCSACGWAAASAARRCSRTASPPSPRWARR